MKSYISDTILLPAWTHVQDVIVRMLAPLFPAIAAVSPRSDQRSTDRDALNNNSEFTSNSRNGAVSVIAPDLRALCVGKELSPLQRDILESIPELTGVWFSRGEVRAKVTLNSMPSHDWFEMPVKKTS